MVETSQTTFVTGSRISAKRSKKSLKPFIILFLLLLGLIGGLFLIRYRQILKERAVLTGCTSKCGIKVCSVFEDEPSQSNNGVYSTRYTIQNISDTEKVVVLGKWRCVCPQGGCPQIKPYRACGQCQQDEEAVNLNSNETIERTLTVQQPGGEICGCYQTDIKPLNVNGDASCKPEDWPSGIYWTNKDCSGQPTPTPTPSLIASPTPTQTPTPTMTTTPVSTLTPTNTPTPTGTPVPGGCFFECQSDGQCQSGSQCLNYGATKKCLNPSCPTETDCGCNGCWQLCSNDWECLGEMKCLLVNGQKRCVNKDCPAESNCHCPSITQTPTVTAAPPPVTGIKIPTLAGILAGIALVSFALALIF